MKLIFLRHGQTDWNVERRIQGCQDTELNQTGREQIKRIAVETKEPWQVSRIISSPLARARQSADIFSSVHQVPVSVSPFFRERHFGFLEGQSIEDIERKYLIDCEEIPDSRFGMEPLDQVKVRVIKGINILKETHQKQTLLIITHGSIIKLLGNLYGYDMGIIANGGYIELEWDDENSFWWDSYYMDKFEDMRKF